MHDSYITYMKWEATVRFHHMTDLRAASRNNYTRL